MSSLLLVQFIHRLNEELEKNMSLDEDTKRSIRVIKKLSLSQAQMEIYLFNRHKKDKRRIEELENELKYVEEKNKLLEVKVEFYNESYNKANKDNDVVEYRMEELDKYIEKLPKEIKDLGEKSTDETTWEHTFEEYVNIINDKC